jgi:hypothetical protein
MDRGLKVPPTLEPVVFGQVRLVNRSAISAEHQSQVVTETERITPTGVIRGDDATLLDILDKVLKCNGIIMRPFVACGGC